MANWLDEAKTMTRQDRQKDYGSPLKNWLRTALLLTDYLGILITPPQVAWIMVIVKMAREMHRYKEDNYLDAIGYLACCQQMDEELKALGYSDGIEYFCSAYLSTQDMRRLLDEIERWPDGYPPVREESKP